MKDLFKKLQKDLKEDTLALEEEYRLSIGTSNTKRAIEYMRLLKDNITTIFDLSKKLEDMELEENNAISTFVNPWNIVFNEVDFVHSRYFVYSVQDENGVRGKGKSYALADLISKCRKEGKPFKVVVDTHTGLFGINKRLTELNEQRIREQDLLVVKQGMNGVRGGYGWNNTILFIDDAFLTDKQIEDLKENYKTLYGFIRQK